MSTFNILEQASGVYRATILDEGGAVLSASALTTLKLTLYVIGAGGTITYVNTRNEQNVLNTNNVEAFSSLQTDVLADGTEIEYNLKWNIQPLDTTLVNGALRVERHIALFEWTWGVSKAGKQEVILAVKNLGEV